MFKISIFLINLLIIVGISNSYPTLPHEPSLPKSVCSTLTAELTHSNNTLHESDESKLDTKRIQDALHHCTSGHAVKLITSGGKNAFLSGPLTLPSGVTLWVDRGVTLFASRNPRDYDKKANECGTITHKNEGCHPLILATGTKDSGIVGDGVIDGRGGSPMIGHHESWWDIALDATAKKQSQNNPRMIQINGGSNFLMYRISIHNSPNFHVVPSGVNGFIAWGVKIKTPTSTYHKYTHATAKNTDGIDPMGSTNVVIAHSYIDTGDDNIAIKGGSSCKSIIVAHNHFYHGHGMSIGSETNGGVSDVYVTDLSLDGTDNGLRIKSDSSRGGVVNQIKYENICMRNVDHPLVFDSFYSSSHGSHIPNFHDITVKNVHILSSTKKIAVFRGYDDKHVLKITLDNVISDISLTKITASNAEITEGPGDVKNIPIQESNNVKVHRSSHASNPINCTNAFVSFPSI